ncbi:MAG: hypothetical protein HY763_07720 [Planctomycetes bacterium]|nr:hypothetical protein [Planctomycetota bacterium]
MSGEEPTREELLLDWHLDRLDDAERARFASELARDPGLRAKSDRLAGLLRPLDAWATPPAPPMLVDKVLRAVEEAAAQRAFGFGPPTGSGGYRAAPRLPLRELVAIAACVALLVGVGVPGLSALRAQSQNALCGNNLTAIFQGASAYQAGFGGSLPFAGHVPGGTWLASAAPDKPRASNSRHLFLVAKLNFGPKPQNFVCPGSKTGRPMPAAQLARYTDFAAPANITYDSLNLAGPNPNVRPRTPIAYVSDPNPLFFGGRFHESVDPTTTNSPAHHGKGQNVLMHDGQVTRMKTPIYGTARDNLWLAGDIRRYTGTETPAGDDDAFLVPGCPAPQNQPEE